MFYCENCGCEIQTEDTSFEIKIELFARPSPINITEEDMLKDYNSEIEEIIKNLESMSDDEAEEANDEVWESYSFTICKKCRQDFHKKLKARFKEK